MAPAPDAAVVDACNNLAQRLRHLRAEGKYCDVVLVASDTRMEAHRAVLATASSTWQQALQSEGGGRWQGSPGKIEAQPPAELRFPRCARPEVLRLLIDHIYGATTTDQLAALVQGCEGSCREAMQLLEALGPSPSSELPSLRLARTLSTLRRQCIFCDTVLTTGRGQTAVAHRAVLAAGSEALDRYFSEQLPHPGFGGLDAVELALGAAAASSLEALVDRLYVGPVAGRVPGRQQRKMAGKLCGHFPHSQHIYQSNRKWTLLPFQGASDGTSRNRYKHQ
ncbi:klhl36 [Symbiodinium sp. CCMP2456]|nr:klhl36 [Symbiodinium sp. CCMP2456]